MLAPGSNFYPGNRTYVSNCHKWTVFTGTRATIIQTSAIRGSEFFKLGIQKIARNETADPSLRLSAIAALGIYRAESDREFLQEIANGQTRYRYAAQSALHKFSPVEPKEAPFK